MDHEFETQDPERKVRGQRSPTEHNIGGQSAAAPLRQDRLRNLLYALVDGICVWHRCRNTDGDTETRDRVDEVLGEGLHIPVATGSGTVQFVWADRLDELVHDGQCLFSTREFVCRLSCHAV
jgi:hypothetical protein